VLQNALGVPSRIITPAQARALCPLLTGDDIVAAAFSPEDGLATPEAVVHGYAHGARSLGAHVRTNCEAREIRRSGAAISGVVTTDGTVATDTVICAAGAWSRPCGVMSGVDLPVTPLRRQVLFTEPIDGLPDELPMTIDFETSFYFDREGPGILFGMSDPNEVPGFNLETSEEWVPTLIEAATRRAPRIAEAGIRGGWAGLYEVTPDHNAVIGESPDVARFLYASGFSGHGFLQSPAVGEILRDLVMRKPPFVDVAPLSAERFETARLRPEFNVV
jgi:sarcosine oxidase subunit beta